GTIVDSSGNGNDGTQSGGVNYGADGKIDNALSFDGVNDYIYVGNEASFDFERTDAFTTSVWIKAEATPGKYFSVMGKLDYVLGNKGWRILSEYNTGTGVVFLITDNHGVDDVNLLLDPVFDNQWHHVVFTYDGNGVTGGMKGYLDGILKASGGGGSLSSSTLNNVPLKIGGNDQYGVYGNGIIDEVAIFNRALSADEILAHYKRGALRLNISAKSCDDADCDGETIWDKTCTSSPCDISTLSNSQYMQYKIDMQSDSSSTSEVSSVSVFYGTAVNPFIVGGIELIYRIPMEITENSGSSLTDHQVLLTVDTASLISAGKMQADCDDIRFTDSDGSTELSYWVESDCNTSDTNVWVKGPSLAASSTRTIYMYYGNPSVSSASNGTSTFETFADEVADWTGTVTTVDGRVRLLDTSSSTIMWSIPSTYNQDQIFEMKYKTISYSSQAYNFFRMSMWHDSPNRFTEHALFVGSRYTYQPGNIEYWSSAPFDTDLVQRTVLRKSDSQVDYYIFQNGIEQASATNIAFGAGTPTAMSSLTFWAGSTNAYCDIRVAWALVRKYASSEPTYTIGSEQQNVAAECTDNDGDGYGAEGTNLTQCDNPTVPDCNDTNADINPEAYDIVGNGIDEDCSGADASYNFSIETEFLYPSEISTYYQGDEVWYQITIRRDGVLYDPSGIELNLTNHYGTLYNSHTKSDMVYVSSGVYKGYFDSTTFDNSVPDIRYDVWIYGDMDEQLDYNVHYDFTFPDGTVPSFISTAYTYLTDALSNHTVKDLVVNSSEAKIDWSGTKLDLHEREIDLDSALIIGDRSAYLDSATFSELNDSATLTFYNVNCASAFVFYSETANTRVAILAENKQCLPPRCTDIQCAGSTLTVTVSSFTGYAAESDANLTIDADDPKFVGAEVHFTADYRNVSGNGFISGATCTIYFTDGNYPMAEGANIYTYNRTFVTEGLKNYNVTCSKAGFSTLTAFDNATIASVEIPEFSIITLGLGLIAVLAGLVVMRRKR
ncbi:MAG: DUF2341 domain-containing protein, partial [Nanoarchaeota archaeon]|nr:DUF2341 domain-containing protein [Nanoarchaeota archaeon]